MAADPQLDTRRQYGRKSHSPCDTSAGRLSQMLLMHQFAFMVDHGVVKTAGLLSVGVIGITSIPAKIL